MTEEKKQENKNTEAEVDLKKVAPPKPAIVSADTTGEAGGKSVYAKKKRFEKNKKKSKSEKPQEEFEQRIVDLARVTRVMAGGKRMRFRACVAIGDKKGRVGIGLAKGADVTIAITKAVNKAKKNVIVVPIVNQTIPHEIYKKVGAAKILLIPARKGKGVIAGGAARVVLELAGIHNVTSKILGTNNKVNIVKSVIEALNCLKKVEVKVTDNKKGKEAAVMNTPVQKQEILESAKKNPVKEASVDKKSKKS